MGYDDLPMNWVGDWAGRRRQLSPSRPALYDPDAGRRWTYAELDQRAERVGSYLVNSLGLSKGDPVCFIGRNRVEPIDLYLAAGKTGIVLAPLSYRLAKPELDDLLGRIQPRALFYEDCFAELVDSLEIPASVQRSIIFADGPCAYADQVLATEPAPVNVPLALNDPFLYIHTGGTTSTPKVCVVSHRQMVWNSVELTVSAPEGLAGRRELLIFPFFHIGGWNTLTPIFHNGGYTVVMRQFDPGAALELIEGEGINHLGAVEAMLKFMLDHPRFPDTDLSGLQGITTAAAPCSAATMKPFWDLGIPVGQAYGLTEGGPSNFVHGRLDESLEEMKAHHDSIGTSFFHCDYRIAHRDTLEPVAPGEPGVLLLRSPHNFDGYLNEPERTGKMIREGGWIYTGDLAREDADGFVYIVGRADNMFISGGENVSPEEIEGVLTAHPEISQAAVFGIPDERWGQVPMAVLVPARGAEPTEQSVRDFCEGRLARYRVPRRMVFADALPLTGAGKIDRNAARSRYVPEEDSGQ